MFTLRCHLWSDVLYFRWCWKVVLVNIKYPHICVVYLVFLGIIVFILDFVDICTYCLFLIFTLLYISGKGRKSEGISRLINIVMCNRFWGVWTVSHQWHMYDVCFFWLIHCILNNNSMWYLFSWVANKCIYDLNLEMETFCWLNMALKLNYKQLCSWICPCNWNH